MPATPEQIELRGKLVAALRSEDIKQGKGWLRSGDYYCCLGVACEVAGIEVTRRVGSGYYYGALQKGCSLPEEARRAYGFRSDIGEYGTTSLAAKNDRGIPFSEIADIIESNPPGLWED